MDDRKLRIHSLIRSAELLQHHEADHRRYQHALETLLLAEKETNLLIDDVTAAIATHDEKGEVLKKEAAILRAAHDRNSSPGPDEVDSGKGKGKAVEKTDSTSPINGDGEDGDLPRTPAGEEHAIKRRTLQVRLRECRVTLHKVKFLQAS